MTGDGVAILRRAVVLVAAAAAPATGHAAQARPAAIAAPLVFDGVTVVDVEHGTLLPDRRVVIVGTRIQAVGSHSAALPKGAQVVPATGKYLVPGLWELHYHPYPNFVPESRPKSLNTTTELAYPLFIANGITGFRVPLIETWPLDSMVQWRREIVAGSRIGPPRQILSAVGINSIGGGDSGNEPCDKDGFFAKGWREHPEQVARLRKQVCVTPGDSADIDYLVQLLKKDGADWIKTYELDRTSYFLVGAAARRAGLLFGGHAPHVSPFEAADSGASIIEHMFSGLAGPVDSLCFSPHWATVEGCRAVAERWQRTNTWSVPTVTQMSGNQMAFGTHLNSVWIKAAQEFWATFKYNPGWLHGQVHPDSAIQHLKIPMQVGLPILSGVDGNDGDTPFRSHAELALLVEQGLTPLAALQAATLNPAKMLRATDSLGTVAPGKLADLVLLDANPLTDITNTTEIRAVVANGRYFDRAALDGLLERVRAQIQQIP